VPALWTAFVLGWLPGFGIVLWALLHDSLALPRLVAVLLALGVLAAVYLDMTLRCGLEDADLAPAGPDRDAIRRRLRMIGVVVQYARSPA